ncbi:hypothetical protein MMYC01_208360 [Madurella mycetomatis]|uniref:Vegetative incompatibility protein HET-E-1 n=1 Tax=Madurella mycetomatis TaxID=100816 RepID=A0A175VRW7_9PEZI|nr:hypothetical protein MMYC01_208360 [Madurella mycetomatis]
MGPLSIIGVAAAAVQFLDLGTRLLVETIGVYQGASAISSRLTNLSETSDELAEFARQVQEKMSLLAPPDHVLTVSETAILDACHACESSSQEVMEFISQIRGRVVPLEEGESGESIDLLESFRTAVKFVSKESRIHDMEAKERSVGQKDVPSDNTEATSCHQRLMERLSLVEKDYATASTTLSLSVFTYSVPADPASTGDAACMRALLANLHFPSLDSRAEIIPEAYERKFDWIFREPRQSDQGRPMWPNFPNRFEGDAESVFWITGKPGSGKSTMMEYLVIEEAPNLGPKLLPGRWAMLKVFGETSVAQLPPWTWRELFESLNLLASFDDRPFNLAFFVDGLDEFDGDYIWLIDVIKLFHSRPGIKVCVSSRPWSDFRDAFADSPQLRMEMLTKHDMELFAAFPVDAQELLSGIVEKAKGTVWSQIEKSVPKDFDAHLAILEGISFEAADVETPLFMDGACAWILVCLQCASRAANEPQSYSRLYLCLG